MRRHTLAGLLASAASTPWAMQKEQLEAARRALLGMGPAALNARLPVGARPELLLAEGVEPEETDEEEVPEEDRQDEEQDGEDRPNASGPRAAIHPATERAASRRAGSVAIIPVRGTISPRMSIFDWLFGFGSTSPAAIVRAATAAVNDDAIKAVVFDYDTPGGSVIQVQEAFDALFALRGKKPMVAQVSGICCSAGFWIAAAQDEIVATESALVGSHGVYMLHENWAKFYAELGVEFDYVQAGENKTEGSEYGPLTEDARAHLQEMVDDYMTMFTGALAKGRGVPASTVLGKFGQGRAYTAARAMGRGMVDKVRSLTDTLLAYGVNPNDADPQARRGRAAADADTLRRDLTLLELGG